MQYSECKELLMTIIELANVSEEEKRCLRNMIQTYEDGFSMEKIFKNITKGERKMSDIIEEELRERYKNLSITLKKDLRSYRGYEIMFSMGDRQGFKFVYKYDDTLTLDKNIEEIILIIDKLIIDYYKKGE